MRTRWLLVAGIGLIGMPLRVVAEDAGPGYAALPAHLPPHMGMPASEAPARSLVDQFAGTYATPKAVAAFLRKEFTFQRDEELFGEVDHWQTPEEFAARKVGDCEDYALLAQALLRRNGIEAYVFSLFGEEGYAHTVSVFVEDGRYNVINQGKIRYYRAKSLEALASALYPSWTFGGIVEQDGTRGRMVRAISNDHPAPPLVEDDVGGFPF